MELLVTPFLHRAHGGFYDDEDHRWSSAVQLERIVDALPRIAAIDAMQHWIYTDPAGSDRDSREQQRLELCGRFMRGADWSGLQDYLIARWHTHAHFFLYPFATSSRGSGRSPPADLAQQPARPGGCRARLPACARARQHPNGSGGLPRRRLQPDLRRQPMRELIGLVERQHLALC
jgi:oligoendopeptidase F